MSKKEIFDHLMMSDRWTKYFKQYAYGNTVIEQLIHWLSQVNNMVENVNQWNSYLEGFVEQFDEKLQPHVYEFLQELYDNGDLKIIIDKFLDTKSNEIDETLKEINTQLSQTSDKVENVNNAQNPLYIPTYDGFDQTTHPDILYFENSLWGYKYWMVHTPYPFSNDFYENPSIVVSNDGVNWLNHPDIENPLASVTQEESENGEHLSDGILIYRSDIGQLECWWRFRNKKTNVENMRRRTTQDGTNWSAEEAVFSEKGLSPTVIYEHGKYRMWNVAPSERYAIQYRESTSLPAWTSPITIPLHYAKGEQPVTNWHIHVFKERNNLYHLILNNYVSGYVGQKLLWGTSSDGMNFNNVKTILTSPQTDSAWDGGSLYRSTLTKVGNTYKLYYAGRGIRNWYIGLVEGKQIDNLKSSGNIDYRGYTNIQKVRTGEVKTPELVTNEILLSSDESPDNKKPFIKFLDRGVSGATVTTGSKNNELEIRNDSDTGLGDLSLSALKVAVLRGHGSGIKLETPIYVDGSSDNPAELIIRHLGSTSKKMVLGENGDLSVLTEPGSFAPIRVSSIVLEGETYRAKEGSIRYNKTTKKHQGYDGTTWHDMY